jgi:hypothetical protein
MTRAAALKLVPAPGGVDLYATWRAEIAARDWSAVHVWADKQRPVYLGDRPQRTWAR